VAVILSRELWRVILSSDALAVILSSDALAVILSREALASHPESRSDERIAVHPRQFNKLGAKAIARRYVVLG